MWYSDQILSLHHFCITIKYHFMVAKNPNGIANIPMNDAQILKRQT